MLILTRKTGQAISIGGGVVVRVLGTDRGRVRLGISAPPDVRVDREEVAARRREAVADERRDRAG